MTMNYNDYLTISEVAAMKGVDRKTVYNWIDRGIAPSNENIRGRYLFDPVAVAAFTPPTRGRKPHAG